jgi:apolipoprotein N-acyltransferase
MVRAVNTGISAVIDGDGVIRARAIDPDTHRSKEVDAILVETVPLDSRSSLYVAYGDLFAGFCLAACGLILAGGLLQCVVFPRRQLATASVGS